jgi:hypothetical protein
MPSGILKGGRSEGIYEYIVMQISFVLSFIVPSYLIAPSYFMAPSLKHTSKILSCLIKN